MKTKKTMKRPLICLSLTTLLCGANCPNGGVNVPIDPLVVTPTLREACSTSDGVPLDDAYILAQLIALEAMRVEGVQKPTAIEMSRVDCIDRINQPCNGVVCDDDDDLPLKVNCMECSAAIAHQIYGEIFEP